MAIDTSNLEAPVAAGTADPGGGSGSEKRYRPPYYSQVIGALGIGDVVEEIRRNAVDHDANRTNGHEEIAALKKAGYGGVRLPEEEGGLGISRAELLLAHYDLAVADPALAHSWRNHLNLVESYLRGDKTHPEWQRFAAIVRHGGTVQTAAGSDHFHFGEQGWRDPVRLSEEGDGYRLNGTTYFSTGNIYADYLMVGAVHDSDGKSAGLLIPVDRPGLTIPDDFAGIGQRASGSGTTQFRDVPVTGEDFFTVPTRTVSPNGNVFTSVFMTAAVAASIEAAHVDLVNLIRDREQNYYHGVTERPRDEHILQVVVGRLSAYAYAARSTIFAAFDKFNESWEITFSSDEESGTRARRESSVAAVQAKIFLDELAQKANSLLFDAGSGRTVSIPNAFDRHWRNARTVSLHNPALYKARILGDFELNDASWPGGLFF